MVNDELFCHPEWSEAYLPQAGILVSIKILRQSLRMTCISIYTYNTQKTQTAVCVLDE